MNLEQRASYLVLHNQSQDNRTVEILGDLPSALQRWQSGTRISPIWAIREFCRHSPEPDPFDGKSTLLFLGPIQLARLQAEIRAFADAAKLRLWASMGCFNAVISTADRDNVDDVIQWARTNNVPFEAWNINDGRVGRIRHSVLKPTDYEETTAELAALASTVTEPALRTVLQENLTAIATAIARAGAVYSPAYSDFKNTAAVTKALLDAWHSGDLSTLEVHSRLLASNAAISRFSSQAFSGVPPIIGTECHFWIHSLLGTGSANIALSRLVGWLQKLLGEADLPQRIAELESDTLGVPSLADLASDAQYLERDLLTRPPPEPDGIPVPLITYFSGRDGFSSHLQTLSAPLTAIAECNSYRSNLLTVTHEIAHILVQVLLTHIYPDLNQSEGLQIAEIIAKKGYRAANWLMAARQLLLEGIIGMEQAESGQEIPMDDLAEELPTIAIRQRREAQEIIVHTLDFWYFYRGEPDFYIKSIWHSWCAIPGIEDRVPEYLMRTLCAVSVNLLRESAENRFPAALRGVRDTLKSLKAEGGVLSDYISIALEHIDRIERDSDSGKDFERQYSARLLLVRLVGIFLASDRLAAKLFSDRHVGKGSGYESKQTLEYDQQPIGNPLSFFRAHLKNDPGESESLWVLHCLAFDMVADNDSV